MTPISSSRKTSFVARSAILLAVALILSYIETLIPLSSFIPLPGFKLGLANVAVVIAYFAVSPYAAAAISLLRVIISSLLFSGVTALIFSLFGAVSMAFAHNMGQLAGSVIVMKNLSVLWYYPALALSAVICGALTCALLSVLPDRLYTRKV